MEPTLPLSGRPLRSKDLEYRPSIALDEDENVDDIMHALKYNRFFRFHAVFGGILCLLFFVGWTTVVFLFNDYTFPWFIFPNSFVLLTLSFHYFWVLRRRDLAKLHFSLFGIINVTCFQAWLFGTWDFAWFIFPLGATTFLLVTHLLHIAFPHTPWKGLMIHVIFFIILNAMAFEVWVELGGMRWFVFVFFATTIPLSLHYIYRKYQFDPFLVHAVLFTNVNGLLFCIWALTTRGLPWFVVPEVVWSIILLIHGWRSRRRVDYQTFVPHVVPSVVVHTSTIPPHQESSPALQPS